MPKIKTHSGAKKRFKLTKTGKVKRAHAFKSHILNKKTTKDVKSTADGLKIKASMKVGAAEKLFDTNFGVTVQIKDKSGAKLVPNEITIGKAARGEY